jgi:hypothetical protein
VYLLIEGTENIFLIADGKNEDSHYFPQILKQWVSLISLLYGAEQTTFYNPLRIDPSSASDKKVIRLRGALSNGWF